MTRTSSPLVYLPVGLPGCGKTAWASRCIAEHRSAGGRRADFVRLSRDDLRAQLTVGYRDPEGNFEDLVTVMRNAMLTALLGRRCPTVVMDETNLDPRHLRPLIATIANFGARWELVDFTGVPLETCVARDAARGMRHQVGEAVIRKLHGRWIAPGATLVTAEGASRGHGGSRVPVHR